MTASKDTQFDDNNQQNHHHQQQYQQSHNNFTHQHDNHTNQANTNNNSNYLNNIQKPSSQNNNTNSLIQVETFVSFATNRSQQFHILLDKQCESSQLTVNVTNPVLGPIETNLDWIGENNGFDSHSTSKKSLQQQQQNFNKCLVSFVAPIVGLYTVIIEHSTHPLCNTRFMTKAYDLSKVFIHKTSTSCQLNDSFEFSVDASEAGEGQLEIAVNEGEIPNQVQVLNNGKCIVSFVPEESVPHMVDIKFNGHNVNGCPFIVEVLNNQHDAITADGQDDQSKTLNGNKNILQNQLDLPSRQANQDESLNLKPEPQLIKNEKILVNTKGTFSLENIHLDSSNLNDIMILDPTGKTISCTIRENHDALKYIFEYKPTLAGDYVVELKPNGTIINKLPRNILQQFPFPLKVFDYNKVIVSEVTDGVVGNPIYFFIDALQAGSGNLEIRVSSTTQNVPNYPQPEANAKIRVNFTPMEPIDHTLDIKFNGYPVPGNPFCVKVAPSPQARLSSSEEKKIQYVNCKEITSFHIDYIGNKGQVNLLKSQDCEVSLLSPDFVFSKLDDVKLIKSFDANTNELDAKFKVTFQPTKVGPHKFFIKVNNELLPASPIICNVSDINEIKVTFAQPQIPAITTKNHVAESSSKPKPIAMLNLPMTFIVDASRAGEGVLALIVSDISTRTPVHTESKSSEQAAGLYELTFVPIEFAQHKIDMSFNERCLPNSPFIVDVIDAEGNIAPTINKQPATKLEDESSKTNHGTGSKSNIEPKQNGIDKHDQDDQQVQLARGIEGLNVRENGNINDYKSHSGNNDINNHVNGGTGFTNGIKSVATSSKKNLGYGIVNASNIVYLESGILENHKNQVSLTGPHGEKVPYLLAKGSPQRGEPKKTYLEYKPKEIGTHTINVLVEGNELRQYFLETCDPTLVKVTGLDCNKNQRYFVHQPIRFLIDSSESGEIQLDNILIHGPKSKHRDGENTILGRIKSMSSSSTNPAHCLEYSIHRLNDHEQEVTFVPQLPGKHSIYIKCLAQQVGTSPYEIDVLNDNSLLSSPKTTTSPTSHLKHDAKTNNHNLSLDENHSSTMPNDAEILQNIIVHGVSLKCSPVNSTGAFIIETNRFAQATDFDVVVTDPNNSPVDVQFYLQQDANLLAEWVPKRVGPHKIVVLYKDEHVPGSPFITEAFDPSGVLVDKIQKTLYSVGDKIEFKVDRKHAGHGELDVAISSPAGNELPIDVKQLLSDTEASDDPTTVGEIISFVPPIAGKYKLSILFGGFEVPNSPITFNVRDLLEPLKLSGTGLRGAEVNRTSQFVVESPSLDGQLKVRIECGDREIVPKVDQIGTNYTIKYKPIQVGYATISLFWNGSHIDGSPFAVPVNDLSKILFLSGSNRTSTNNNQRIIYYEPNQPKDITVDTAKCGPGELVAEAYCRANPNTKFNITVDQFAVNRYRLVFFCPPKKEQLAKGISLDDISLEASYMIRFYYNNLSIPEQLASVVVSPADGSTSGASSQLESSNVSKSINSLNGSHLNDSNNNSNNDTTKQQHELLTGKKVNGSSTQHMQADDEFVGPPVVSLRGHGLAEARIGEQAEFTINGSKAGPGQPTVSLQSADHGNLNVNLELTADNIYLASYIPESPGKYTLNVLWDDKQVAGCPITVNVADTCDSSRVLCTGDGLKGGVFGEEIKVLIDTRRAGPGELTALCMGPQAAAISELLDRGDGTFILYIKPQEAGRHILTIKYGGKQIPKSPFAIKISGRPDPSKVRVYGSGIEHGVLSLYQSRFTCDTRGAGAGQLTVRIRGPKGAFRMETQRSSTRDRCILCKYDPTEPGDYRIEIKWSGEHVPGSPYHVMIFDTQEELNRFLRGLSPYYYNYM